MLFPSQENARWFVRSIHSAGPFTPLFCLVDSSAAHIPVAVADERLGGEIVSKARAFPTVVTTSE